MGTITLYRHTTIDNHTAAVQRDYDCGENPNIFLGFSDFDETVLAFVSEDGSAFVAVDNDPEGYIKFSNAMKQGNFEPTHPGVDEWTVDPGTFNYYAGTIEITSEPTIW